MIWVVLILYVLGGYEAFLSLYLSGEPLEWWLKLIYMLLWPFITAFLMCATLFALVTGWWNGD